MQTRILCNNLNVNAVGLGCMGMSEFYGPRDDQESLQVLPRATELGVTFFDTTDMYGSGHNEELLGQYLAGSKANVIIATKFGIRRDPGEHARSLDNSPEYAHGRHARPLLDTCAEITLIFTTYTGSINRVLSKT